MSSSIERAAPTSATAVVTAAAASTETETPAVYTIQLQPRAHVTFDDSVVDNEHLGRKKSNKCCVFHKKRAFGESSSESGEGSSGDEHKHTHDKHCAHRNRKPASQRPNKPQPFVPADDTHGPSV